MQQCRACLSWVPVAASRCAHCGSALRDVPPDDANPWAALAVALLVVAALVGVWLLVLPAIMRIR